MLDERWIPLYALLEPLKFKGGVPAKKSPHLKNHINYARRYPLPGGSKSEKSFARRFPAEPLQYSVRAHSWVPPTWRRKLRTWRLRNLHSAAARAKLAAYNAAVSAYHTALRAAKKLQKLDNGLNCGKRVLSFETLFARREAMQALAETRLMNDLINGTSPLQGLSRPKQFGGLRSQLEVNFENFIGRQPLKGLDFAYVEEVDPGYSTPSITFDGRYTAHVPDFYLTTQIDVADDPSADPGDLFEVDIKDYSRIVKQLKAATSLPHNLRDLHAGVSSGGTNCTERFRTYKRARHELLNSILYST